MPKHALGAGEGEGFTMFIEEGNFRNDISEEITALPVVVVTCTGK